MQQRDILKDQIEQLGKAIGKLIARFLDLKSTGNIIEGIGITNQALKSELDIDIDAILLLEKSDLKDFVENKNLTAEHLETLSEYLVEIGECKVEMDTEAAKTYFSKAIELLELADEISEFYHLIELVRKKIIENRHDDLK